MLDDGWVNSHSGDTLSQGETHDDGNDDDAHVQDHQHYENVCDQHLMAKNQKCSSKTNRETVTLSSRGLLFLEHPQSTFFIAAMSLKGLLMNTYLDSKY